MIRGGECLPGRADVKNLRRIRGDGAGNLSCSNKFAKPSVGYRMPERETPGQGEAWAEATWRSCLRGGLAAGNEGLVLTSGGTRNIRPLEKWKSLQPWRAGGSCMLAGAGGPTPC